jgi:hypothetical protein
MSHTNIHQHYPKRHIDPSKQKQSLLKKKKEFAKLKTWKDGLGKNERPDGLKTRKGVQAKIRGKTKKEITPGGLKTQKGDPDKS